MTTTESTVPDIQYFSASGLWVKPEHATRVDVVLQGAGGGGGLNPDGYICSNGESGDIRVSSFPADALPGEVEVTVGKGGRHGGRDGYALIVTHMDSSSREGDDRG